MNIDQAQNGFSGFYGEKKKCIDSHLETLCNKMKS